jgi:hypothetical protein
MGWGERTGRSHASRLQREGRLERHRMFRGDGSLLVATRRGVRMTGLPVSAPASPEPMSWAHDCASSWTAAWLTVRGAEWRGPREVLVDPELKGKILWSTSLSLRTSGHRPDLTLQIPNGLVAVEVELQRKATNRLAAILQMYRGWIDRGTIAGVFYVCGSEATVERVHDFAERAGIAAGERRVDLLSDVRERALGDRR